MSFNLTKTALAATLALGMVFAAAEQVNAFVIDGSTQVGDSFSVNFQLLPGQTDNGGNTLPGTDPLTATITYTVNQLNLSATGGVNLTIDISNTTTTSLNENITSFGFNLNPNLAVNSFTQGSTFDDYGTNTNFPSFQTIDICIFSQGCSGGAFNSGLAPGDADQVMISLLGDLSGGSLIVDPTVIKFQGDLGSFEFRDGNCCTKVPEPAPMAVFGFGLVALAWVRRRYGVSRATNA